MSFPNAIYCNGEEAPIDDADTIQKHPLGTRMILEDGRVFAYAKAGAAITRLDTGVKNGLPQGVASRSISAAVAIGTKIVNLTCASPDGAAGTGTIVEDEFEGGYILFFVGSGDTQTPQIRRVVSNTGGTTSIDFTFDRALSVALTDSHSAEVLASPYRAVKYFNTQGYPVVGVPTVTATSGQYLWVQTWGVCWLSLQSDVGVAGNYGLVFRHDGSLDKAFESVDTHITNQYAGFCLAETSSLGQAAPFFMLQICP